MGGVAGAFLATLLGFALATPLSLDKAKNVQGFVLGSGLIRLGYDLPFSILPFQTITNLVIVYMDDESHVNLGQPFNAGWDRAATHAKLLDRLKKAGAQAAVFDIVFSDPSPGTNRTADIKFARSIKAFGNVVLGADYAANAVKTNAADHVPVTGQEIVPPYEPLMDAAAAIGTVEIPTDPDLVARKHNPHSTNDLVASLSWAAAELIHAPITQRAGDWGYNCWIRYYGPPKFLPNISYWKALDPSTPDSDFRNKVVFIGSGTTTKFSGQRKDQYLSPYSLFLSQESQYMPGVEVQTTRFLNIAREDWLNHIGIWKENLLIALAGLLFGFGLILVRPFYAAALGICSMAGVAALDYYLVAETHTWFYWLIVDAQIGAATGWSVVFNTIALYVQKRLMEQSLAMYVSPQRVKQIAKRPEILKPGAEKQELSILFSDIANFTSMSEGMDSDELARFMNNYFERAVAHCLHPTDGTVVKYIGDAIFAIWNAPEPQLNHQELACQGALLLRDQVSAFEDPRLKSLRVRTRIGLHCGVANVGNFGSSTRIDYTAIGENINLASRMEGLNKHLGTDVVITGDIERVVRGRFLTRFAGQFRLKGFEKLVPVYELLARANGAAPTLAWREAFAQALGAFKARQWDHAEAQFQCVLKMKPDDGPSGFYLKHLAEFRAEPPTDDWTGEIELKEK